jgi:bacteriocin biosynthesis cyclodehydratase domain-containing protein
MVRAAPCPRAHTSGMVLKLDGRYATVWRDPFSLQIGVDPARVVLREVTTAEERMIAALGSGVSRSGLEMIAGSSGASEQEVSSLLRKLKVLLLPEPTKHPDARVSIVGSGQTVDRIATTLALADVSVTVSATAVEEDSDLGIAVGHYVLDPDSYGFWLRRDLPHVPVVFGDDSVQIGPLVEPGNSPCLYCLEHYRRDADASWAAIASQLWGRRASSETALVSAEVAARVARLVLLRLETGRPPTRSMATRSMATRSMAARSFRLFVESGEVTRRDWMPHPDCGCVTLSADRPGTDSAPDSDPPTTVSVSASRA